MPIGIKGVFIKQHQPRYNVRLKDDKTYVSLRLNTAEDFPRITVVRRYRKDGARYFGPYSSAGAVRETLRQVQRLVLCLVVHWVLSSVELLVVF